VRVTRAPDDLAQYKTDLAERLIFGSLDNDAPRVHLTDLAFRHRIVYIDAATVTHAA
jgi:hypothetical protein